MGQCTSEERARLHAWFNVYAKQEAHGLEELQAMYEVEKTRSHRQKFIWLPYVAAIFIVGLVGIWYFYEGSSIAVKTERHAHIPVDIAPGGNRAILTLANGRTVNLSETQKGIVVDDDIRYNDGSSVVGEQEDKLISIPPFARSLMLSTPKGGTYQITLSDGTQVWLNAASTLTYPEQFADNERAVRLEGEAYFSVVKDEHRPFRIKSRGQEIVVLGTEFNVSAYHDDVTEGTTLVEGSVLLQSALSGENTQLFAREQGLIKKGTIKKQTVDPTPFVAWKNGDFYFDNTSLVDMMKQIERWYDVDVIYEGQVPQERFSGGMSRNVTLQTVLQLLKVSEIKYYISGKILIIE